MFAYNSSSEDHSSSDQDLKQKLKEELATSWAQTSLLRNFLESISDLEPESIYNVIINKASEFLDRNSIILFSIDAQESMNIKSILGIDVNIDDIKKIHLNGIDINIFRELNKIYYGEIEIFCSDKIFIIKSAITFPLINQNNRVVGLISAGNFNTTS